MFDFSGKVVMVTGAAGNLGSAVTRAFQGAGASLVLVDRDCDRLPTLYPELVGSPSDALFTSTDVTDSHAVGPMVKEVLERFARIDVLANTVGGYRAGAPVQETSVDTWEFMLNLNARSAFVLSQAVVPAMLERGTGKIVHVSARAGLKGGAKAAAYSASKSAVIRLVESMAAELRHSGIHVNCVLPGTIDTPQNRESMPRADHNRWVAPAAIADVYLFLASEAARGVNGAAIPVYGRS